MLGLDLCDNLLDKFLLLTSLGSIFALMALLPVVVILAVR